MTCKKILQLSAAKPEHELLTAFVWPMNQRQRDQRKGRAVRVNLVDFSPWDTPELLLVACINPTRVHGGLQDALGPVPFHDP